MIIANDIYVIIRPKSIAISKCRKSALRANPRATKDDNFAIFEIHLRLAPKIILKAQL